MTGEELAAFALEHIPERAAAPKEVHILEQMPLTDIQKPSKQRLRHDAARRVFSAALAEALGEETAVEVDVGPHDKHGTLVTVKVKRGRDREAIERTIQDVMKVYPFQYVIEWGYERTRGKYD